MPEDDRSGPHLRGRPGRWQVTKVQMAVHERAVPQRFPVAAAAGVALRSLSNAVMADAEGLAAPSLSREHSEVQSFTFF